MTGYGMGATGFQPQTLDAQQAQATPQDVALEESKNEVLHNLTPAQLGCVVDMVDGLRDNPDALFNTGQSWKIGQAHGVNTSGGRQTWEPATTTPEIRIDHANQYMNLNGFVPAHIMVRGNDDRIFVLSISYNTSREGSDTVTVPVASLFDLTSQPERDGNGLPIMKPIAEIKYDPKGAYRHVVADGVPPHQMPTGFPRGTQAQVDLKAMFGANYTDDLPTQLILRPVDRPNVGEQQILDASLKVSDKTKRNYGGVTGVLLTE